MLLSTRKKAQAIRRPSSLRDHLVYALTLGYASFFINMIVLTVILSAVAYLVTNDTLRGHIVEWKAAEDRMMYLDHIPDYTSERCYLTLLKRLQSTTDVREDGTVEINEIVLSEPSQDCSSFEQFR